MALSQYSSQYSNVTDELLSAYIDGVVTDAERALVEDAVVHDPQIAWRLNSLRQTVSLLGQLTDVPLPRSFVLTETMLAEPVPSAEVRRAASNSQPTHAPSLWERWQQFWRSGNLMLRNAATVCAVLLVVLLAGTYSVTETDVASDDSGTSSLASISEIAEDIQTQAEQTQDNGQRVEGPVQAEMAASAQRASNAPDRDVFERDVSGNDIPENDIAENETNELAIAPSAMRLDTTQSRAMEAPVTEGDLTESGLNETTVDESGTTETSSPVSDVSESSNEESRAAEPSPPLAASAPVEAQVDEDDGSQLGAAELTVESTPDESVAVASIVIESMDTTDTEDVTENSRSADAEEIRAGEAIEESAAANASPIAMMNAVTIAPANVQDESQTSDEAMVAESPLAYAANSVAGSEGAGGDDIIEVAPPTSTSALVALADDIALAGTVQDRSRFDEQRQAMAGSADEPDRQTVIVTWLLWLIAGLFLLFVVLWLRSRNRSAT